MRFLISSTTYYHPPSVHLSLTFVTETLKRNSDFYNSMNIYIKLVPESYFSIKKSTG